CMRSQAKGSRRCGSWMPREPRVEKATRSPLTVTAVEAVTPHNQALYEAGKKLLVESIETGRAFCKFMITTNMAAVPVYLGLLGFWLPAGYRVSATAGAVLLVPPRLFLLGAIVAAYGFLPGMAQYSLDLPAEIAAARNASIRRRRTAAGAATAL